MANQFYKLPLSGSDDGRAILITAATSASAQQIHTVAPSGSVVTDEVYLYAYNDATGSIVLSVLWGAGSEPGDVFRTTIGSRTGRNLIVDGRILQNGHIIYAYAGIAGQVVIEGFVNRISVV